MKRFLIVFICLFCLSACSAKLAYNFLGFITKWYVGSYVSLTREQKLLIDETIEDFKHWHRQSQLPLYAAYIEQASHHVQNNQITGSWIHQETDKLQDFLDSCVNFLMPNILTLVASFSDGQTEEFLEELTHQREKYKKKHVHVDEDKRLQNQIDELSGHLPPFFGRFTKEQKQWIEQWSQQVRPYEALTLEQQKIWAQRVDAAFKIRHNQSELEQHLQSIMFYRTDDWNPDLQSALDFNQDITYDLIARLINSQNEKQRAQLIKKLEAYQRDFLSLAAQGED